MYVTDERFYNSIYENPVVRSTISGRIDISEIEHIDISDDDIVPRSLSVDNKCVNGDAFQYGSVFQGELNVTLKKEIDRYSLYDKTISFTVHQKHSDGSVQDIPIGEFVITDPQRSKKLITIKAADAMANFDVDIVDSFFGSIFEVLTVASEACGVELQQTEAELTALTNGDVTFSAYNGQVRTYRDLLCYIGQVTCSFATINRFGKLEFKVYGKDAVREIPINRRNDTVMSDYQTYYKGVKVTFAQNESKEEFSHVDETSNGLIMDLGEIPIVFGVAETKQGVIDNIFAELSVVKYTPASFRLLISDPTLELGDKISLGGLLDVNMMETYIMSYTWKYHDSMPIKGVGGNPRLVALRKKDEVELSDLANSIAAKNMIVYTYTNAGKFTFSGDTEKEIISISYTTIAGAIPIFIATIPVEMSTDGYLTLKYNKNDAPIDTATITKYLEKGKHFVTCMFHTSDKENTWNMLSVVATTEYVQSNSRVQASEIDALKTFATSGSYPTAVIDQTIPTATIEKQGIKAVLFGQGLASNTKEWDGRISFIETVPPMKLGVSFKKFTDSVATEQIVPTPAGFAETVGAFKLGVSFKNFTESVVFSEVIAKHTIETAKVEDYVFNVRYVDVAEGIFTLNHNYGYTSEAGTIDSGFMREIIIDKTEFESIEEVKVGE